MSIIDKANEYIGHPQKMDESYTDTIARNAYADGYKDAIDKACEWLSDHSEDITCKSVGLYGCKAVMSEDLINNLRKAMEE